MENGFGGEALNRRAAERRPPMEAIFVMREGSL